MKNRTTSVILIVSAVLVLSSLEGIAPERSAAARRRPAASAVRVGVFDGRGASAECVLETYEALRIDRDIRPSYVSALDIARGALKDFDVLVFPGGSGSREYNTLGLNQRETIRDFVLKNGGGIVGICAGAYLISDTEGYPCLNLIDAEAIDREHDERGSALAEISFTGRGFAIFPEMKGIEFGFIQYHDGPVFIPSNGRTAPSYDELAVFKSDIHLAADAPTAMTPLKPVLLCQEAGEGRVFACSGHPERTKGMRWIVPRMVRWVARMDLVPYPSDVVRPSLNDREIMHSDKLETELFWRLFDESPERRTDALRKLADMQYGNAPRWAVGMLRDTSPEAKSLAAKIVTDNEYTAAIPDLEAALSVEKDDRCRASLEACLNRLKQLRRD
jgi:hypothetical protein